MVETDFSGDYLNNENAKQGDLVEVTGEGEYIEKEFENRKKLILNIPVLVNGRVKTYSPSVSNGKVLVKAWGSDTKHWIGKKAYANVVNYKSFGQTKQTIELTPLDESKI